MTPSRVVSVSAHERFGVERVGSGDVHLKEWSYAELAEELRRAGFVGLRSPWRNGRLHRLPLLPVAAKVAAGRAVAAGPSRRVRPLATVLGTAACSVVAVRP